MRCAGGFWANRYLEAKTACCLDRPALPAVDASAVVKCEDIGVRELLYRLGGDVAAGVLDVLFGLSQVGQGRVDHVGPWRVIVGAVGDDCARLAEESLPLVGGSCGRSTTTDMCSRVDSRQSGTSHGGLFLN